MHLSVDAIQRLGGYTGGPVKKQVKWVQGGEDLEAEVHVRPMSYHTAVNDISGADDSGEVRVARRLAACLCTEDGVPIFRVCDITGIDDEGHPIMIKDSDGKKVERGPMSSALTNALLALVGEVSGLGKPKSKKSSREKTTSGTS